MAIDRNRTIEVMTEALLRDLADEVDLIFRYGSLVQGTAHKYSDLDISYTPVHESTWRSITVLVDETLIDLYPIHWSKLARMAEFLDVSSTVLLHSQIVYQRSEHAAERFRGLAARLLLLQQPEARPEMLRKAQSFFEETGSPYYLLRQQAANGNLPACLHHAQQILKRVLHLLAVCNQACIDTRKLPQVLALPKLPAGFRATVERVTLAHEPDDLLAACETLLHTTRDLLLAEQWQILRSETTFPAVFHAAYPELKGALQHVLLACERQDIFALNDLLVSLYHELSLHLTWALTGVEFSGFNSLADYEQDLVALGFPALLPLLIARDFAELHRQCLLFDRRLQEFLSSHSVELNNFATLEDLQRSLMG